KAANRLAQPNQNELSEFMIPHDLEICQDVFAIFLTVGRLIFSRRATSDLDRPSDNSFSARCRICWSRGLPDVAIDNLLHGLFERVMLFPAWIVTLKLTVVGHPPFVVALARPLYVL